MAHYLAPLVLLLACLTVVTTQTCQPPRMTDVQGQADFQVERFLGVWYEVRWIPECSGPDEMTFDNLILNFTRINDTYINAYWATRETTGKAGCIHGNDYLVHHGNASMFTHVIINNSTTGETLETDYWVVLTDYDNYALQYGCCERGADDRCLEGKVNSVVWSRATSMSDEHQQLVDSKIAELCVNSTLYVTIHHDEACPYPQPSNDSPTHVLSTVHQVLCFVWMSWSILHF